jgi:hypothetical protein
VENVTALMENGRVIWESKMALKPELRGENRIITKRDLLKASQYLSGMLFLSE